MSPSGRPLARFAAISVACAMIAGACTGGSGDPQDSSSPTEPSGGIAPGTSRPIEPEQRVIQQFPDLPVTTWAAAGAAVSTIGNEFDVTDYGAKANDGASDSDAFNAAVQAARGEGGGLVTIPEGTFLLTDTVRLVSRVTLRGSGRGTKLELDMGDESGFGISATGSADEDWTMLSGDLTSGSNTLDLGFVPEDEVLEIEHDNNAAILTQPEWDVTWGDASEGEMIMVTGSNDAGAVTVASPLISDYTVDRNARVRQIQPVQDVGVEDLSIIRLDEGYGHMISFRYTLNSWVSNVVSSRTSFAHVGVEQTLNCSVVDSILHDATDFGDGGRAYGVSLARHTTGCVVMNNTLYDLRHALIIQLGASGNVFAYNHARGSAGYEDRRPRADISLHGHWPQRNLFEGNIVDRVEIADWWGPAGPQNTFLRNCVLDHVIVLDNSREQSFVGNIFGQGGVTIDETVEQTKFIANVGSAIPEGADSSELEGGDDASLPDSLWRSDAPQFLGGQWPPIDPQRGSTSCTLPASSRSPLGNR